MWWNAQRVHAVTGGIWLIGFGILFATGAWWPGILFLVALTTIIEGSIQSGWQTMHAGLWMLLFACWALTRFNVTVMFVGMGLYVIIAALVPQRSIRKPYIDTTLE